MNSEEWLTDEDKKCRKERLKRLEWLIEHTPQSEQWLFIGGLTTESLFEEARYCFVYGQFLATVVLGLSFIEYTLAGLFFQTGRNDLKRAKISDLIDEAHKMGWITNDELANLHKAREIRNSIAHFRPPGNKDKIEYRSIMNNKQPYILFEVDAKNVLCCNEFDSGTKDMSTCGMKNGLGRIGKYGSGLFNVLRVLLFVVLLCEFF